MASLSDIRAGLAPARLRDAGAQAFAAAFADNGDRLMLWAPVLFGGGIALCFSAAAMPPWWWGPSAFAFCAAVYMIARLHRDARAALALMAVSGMWIAAGFALAQHRTESVAAPVLAREIGPVAVTGRVLAVEASARDARLLLDRLDIGRLSPAATPARVRVTIRAGEQAIEPGDAVTLLAVLRPPPAPSLPGAFDFARRAWFERLGGVGYALGGPRNVEKGAAGWQTRLSRLRNTLTRRIRAASDDDRTGPVAAAVMTGERRAIPEDQLEAMRDSGLAHLLAISGLHMGLVAGLLFFATRFLLALSGRIALRYPAKKIAALVAIAGALAYLMISGATIPTQRAFVMACIVLFAVLIDRTALSMRLVAVAAVLVLVISPEAMLSVSFQMSFAAVVALIAVYERFAPAIAGWRHDASPLRLAAVFIVTTLLTTAVAGLATAPFAAYHFNRLALFGLLANLVAVPLMAAWIMPCAILAFVLMPFGLESLALVPMGWGLEVVLGVAERVAALPHAAVLLPAMPLWGLVAIALGGLWLCLWRGSVRLAGFAAMVAGCLSVATVRPPDVVVLGSGKLIGIRTAADGLALSPGRGDSFERETWLRRFGLDEASPWPTGAAGNDIARCDGAGCIVRTAAGRLAIVRDVAAAEDCGRVEHVVLVSAMPRRLCPRPAALTSRYRLWRDGTHAIRIDADGVRVETVRDRRGNWPWVPRRRGGDRGSDGQ